MQETLEKLYNLVNSGIESNIKLALILAEGQGLTEELIAPCTKLALFFSYPDSMNFVSLITSLKKTAVFFFNTEYERKIQRISRSELLFTYYELFSQVKKVYYNDLQPAVLPNNIKNLTALEVLSLRQSQVKFLPDSIIELIKLKELNLIGNPIKELPENIGKLNELKTLVVGFSKIEHLPETIGNLTKLTVLDVSKNPISTVPESIGELSELTFLILDKSKIQTLPQSLLKLKKLSVINCPIPAQLLNSFRKKMSWCNIQTKDPYHRIWGKNAKRNFMLLLLLLGFLVLIAVLVYFFYITPKERLVGA